jgi:hypothetical protein
LGGVLFAVFPIFHPPNTPEGALTVAWVPVHLLWLGALDLVLLALPTLNQTLVGQRARHVDRRRAPAVAGLAGLAGYALASFGTALSIGIATYDAFIVPVLAANFPPLIKLIEQTVDEPALAAFHAVYYLSIAAFSLGFLLLGSTLVWARRRVDREPDRETPGFPPSWIGALVGSGAPLFWLGLGLRHGGSESWLTVLGAGLFGVGIAAWGVWSGTTAQGGARRRLADPEA